MALRPLQTAEWHDSDSDETHFSPDPDKEPDETRRAGPDDEDAYFERTYNKYLTSPGRAGCWSQAELTAPLPDSDETFFEPAQVVPEADSLDSARASSVDSDETFFDPPDGLADVALAEQYERTADPSEHPGAADPAGFDGIPFGDEEYAIEDVLKAVQEHPEAPGPPGQPVPENSMFSQAHGVGLTETQEGDSATHQGPYCGHDNGVGAEGDDLYIQMRDPVTQEMRTFLVPGMRSQARPACLQLLTQDLDWTQTQFGTAGPASPRAPPAAPAPPSPQRAEAPGLTGFSHDMRLETQDLAWTQTQTQQLVVGGGGAAGPEGDSPMDQGSVPAAPLQSRSSSSFMDVAAPPEAADAAESRPGPLRPVNSSLSSEAAKTSGPSCGDDDDDYLLPLSGLPWPLLGEEECNIAEIVASLSNISFSLDHEAIRQTAEAGPEGLGHSGPPGPPPAANPPATPPPSSPPAAATRAATPRSPTFAVMPRRRGRRARARTEHAAAAGPVAGPQGPVGGGRPALGRAGPPAAGETSTTSTKRKRPGRPSGSGTVGQHPELPGPSGLQGFSCSPSSPPPQKARKSGHRVPSKGRPEMIATYSRLLELRFLMQDIVAGREPFPAAEDIPKIRDEVLAIIGNMRQAALMDGKLTGKAKQKREEARQVADKILHQLRVFAEESQRSCAGTECSSELLVQSMSWSVPHSNNSEASPQDCYNYSSTQVCIKTPQNIPSQSQKKRSKEKKCRKKKTSVEYRESCSRQETSRQFSQTNFKFDNSSCNVEIAGENSGAHPGMIVQPSMSLKVVGENLHQAHLPSVLASSVRNELCDRAPQNFHNLVECAEHSTALSDVHDKTSDYRVRNLPASLSTCIKNPNTSNSPDALDSCSLKQQDINCQETVHEGATGYLFEEKDPKAVTEYQEMVKLIKESATSRMKGVQVEVREDSIWRGGPLKFTGILLPKRSELHPIDDLPPNFWDDPQAPIPEEWISLLDWDD